MGGGRGGRSLAGTRGTGPGGVLPGLYHPAPDTCTFMPGVYHPAPDTCIPDIQMSA